MTGAGGDTGRGFRAAGRGVRTWSRLLGAAVAAAVLAATAAAAWKTWHATTAYEWYAVGVLTVSEALLASGLSPQRTRNVRYEDGRVEAVPLGAVAAHPPLRALRRRMMGDLLGAAFAGLSAAAGLIVAVLVVLHAMGGRLKRGRRLRGGELVSARTLRRRAAPVHRRILEPLLPPRLRPYRIAGLPYPERAETRHTLVSGTTGSGKTILIADLVEQIRARGERCVLYDKMGSYAEAFFDPARDVLLNPLDARAPRWSPFLEARTARDFDTMAAALIPRQKDTVDPFWITAARQLFSHGAAVFWKRGETRNRVLVEHLLKTQLDALAQAMEGTVAQSIVDPANPKTALSVRAMLTANIGAMDLLPDEGRPFSIRDWIEDGGRGGFLFLTSRGDQHASLRGLISTWLEIAVNALLSLPRDDGRRIWVVLDELPTLHQVPSLRPGLAESRQFGGCFVLGVQVFSALRDLYGRDGAETISGLCGTRVVLAAADRDTAEWSAESLGRVEVEEMSEGVSYGAEAPRDGVTLGARRALHPLVLPAEVARLENLSGYLKFPGPRPVARIALRYRKRSKIAERFVPREDGETAAAERPERTDEAEAAGDGGFEAGAGEERTGHDSMPVAGGAQAGRNGTGTGADDADEAEPPVERLGRERVGPRPVADEADAADGSTAHPKLLFEGTGSREPEGNGIGMEDIDERRTPSKPIRLHRTKSRRSGSPSDGTNASAKTAHGGSGSTPSPGHRAAEGDGPGTPKADRPAEPAAGEPVPPDISIPAAGRARSRKPADSDQNFY